MPPFILPSPERLIPHSMVAALGNLSFPPTDWKRKLKPTKNMFMTHYAGVLFTEKNETDWNTSKHQIDGLWLFRVRILDLQILDIIYLMKNKLTELT